MITPIMHADAGLLGAFIRAGLAAINFAVTHHAFTRHNRAKTSRTGAFILRCSLLDHTCIIASFPPLPVRRERAGVRVSTRNA